FTQLFGTSALRKRPKLNGAEANESRQVSEPEPKRAPKDVSLKEVKDQWDSFIELLRREVPQMLYFQMQRLKPTELKNGDLLLHCNDGFAKIGRASCRERVWLSVVTGA